MDDPSEFYTLEEILSTKSEEGLFYGYKNSYTYSAFGYTLYNIPFDLTHFDDPIKLVRSMLLYTNIEKLVAMKVQYILFDIFLFDSHYGEYHFTNQELVDGLIYTLKSYSRLNKKVEEVTMQLLVEFLGAKYYTCASHKYMKSSVTRRSCIFTKPKVKYESLDTKKKNELVKGYESNSKKFGFHIAYCNAILKHKYKYII